MTEKQLRWQKRNRILWRLKGMVMPIDTEVLTPVEVDKLNNAFSIEGSKYCVEHKEYMEERQCQR